MKYRDVPLRVPRTPHSSSYLGHANEVSIPQLAFIQEIENHGIRGQFGSTMASRIC